MKTLIGYLINEKIQGAKMYLTTSDTQIRALKKITRTNKQGDKYTNYYLYYRFEGKRKMVKIAPGTTPINLARKLAIETQSKILQGQDPLNKKDIITFGDVFDIYIQTLEAKQAKTIDDIKRFYDKDIKSKLHNKDVTLINRADIASLHFDITKRSPITANRCLSIINAILNVAYHRGYVEKNHAAGIQKNRETKRKRYMTNDELKRIVHILNEKNKAERNKPSIAFIWLLLLTGARVSEIANAKWSDIEDNKIIIREHKTDRFGENRNLYLTPLLLEILRSLPKRHSTITGIKTPKKLWNTIRKEAGCEDLRLHDLRHSYASWALENVNLSEVGNLLGHRDIATTQRYAHVHACRAEENAQKIGKHLQKLIMSA